MVSVTSRKLVKSELIQIIIPKNDAGTPKTKLQFPDNQNLRNTHLMGIETYSATEVPKSVLTTNNTISADLQRYIFVTLQLYNGKNFQWQLPLQDLKNLAGATIWSQFPIIYVGQRVNWPKSYIEISDATQISITEDQSVLFNIYYKEPAQVEKKDRKAAFKKQS